MQLGLSSAAAPDATVHELITACAGRGLGTLELRAGDAHGIDPAGEWSVDVASALAGAAIAGVRIAAWHSDENGDSSVLAHVSRALDAPVLATGGSLRQRIERATAIGSAGGRSLVLVRGDAHVWHDAITEAGIDYAWEIDAECSNVEKDTSSLLGEPRARLQYIRMVGGGPESVMHEGRGIGSLMGTLALAGFAGPIILTPSSPRYRVAWATWLGRRGGWGCGSKSSSPELVRLPTGTSTGRTA